MATLTIDDSTADALRDQAARSGVSPSEYLRTILDARRRPEPVDQAADAKLGRRMTDEEYEQWWRELAVGSENIPPLPANFSRRDIYEEPE